MVEEEELGLPIISKLRAQKSKFQRRNSEFLSMRECKIPHQAGDPCKAATYQKSCFTPAREISKLTERSRHLSHCRLDYAARRRSGIQEAWV
jgi:hypothetical protein